MVKPVDRFTRKSAMQLLLEAVAYGLVAALSVRLVVRPEGVSAVWFPAGILVAGLLRRPPKQWPIVALVCTFAAIPADLSMPGRTLASSLVMNVADATGFCVIASLVRFFVGRRPTMLHFRDVYTLMWTVAVGSCVAAALAGAGLATLGRSDQFWDVFRVFSLAVILGCLTVMPVMLSWRRTRLGDLFGRFRGEACVLGVGTLAATAVVFFMPAQHSGLAVSLVYVPVIGMSVFVLRRSVSEAAILNLSFAVMASIAFYFGTGPSQALTVTGADRVLWLNGFVGIVVMAVLLLGSLNDERRRALNRFRAERERTTRRIEQRTNELQHAVRDLEAFAYSVSHDLRAPLRGIALHAELIEEEIGSPGNSTIQDSLTAMRDRTERMNRIINGLMRLSRAQRQGLQISRVDVQALVQEIVQRLQTDAVTVTVGTLPECDADRDLLRQVFENLIANAIRYGAGGPNSAIRVQGHVERGGVMYTVEDDGVGFDPSISESIFDLFQRGAGKTRGDSEGVGLAIVKQIVNRHSGTVEASSVQGEGAVFKVWLPASNAINSPA